MRFSRPHESALRGGRGRGVRPGPRYGHSLTFADNGRGFALFGLDDGVPPCATGDVLEVRCAPDGSQRPAGTPVPGALSALERFGVAWAQCDVAVASDRGVPASSAPTPRTL